ncbi:MAG: glutathione S-transferase family protein [Alphaproteobacteria bacterium]|nr:glutathione S-transferase family protein [Alphaproteobacteria bacterium]
MKECTLIIGNKNYSSWSFRAWFALKLTGTAFTEMLVPLDTPDMRPTVKKYSPAGKVPVLVHGEHAVWDSLAIAEYLAELFPEKQLWPEEVHERALARSVVAEMHSGFQAMRQQIPMNMRASFPNTPIDADAKADVARILDIWKSCRAAHNKQGDFLFGHITIADCYFAPVVSRFATYQVALDPVSAAYAEAVQAHPVYQEWKQAALKETFMIDKYERKAA